MRIVLPSVGYSDFLAETLPAWRRVAPAAHLSVVTSPEDSDTISLALELGVLAHVSTAWTEDGAAFNKARALDEALGLLPDAPHPPARGEACLAVDADVFPFGTLPAHDELLRPGTIYGCARYACEKRSQLLEHQEGRRRIADMQLIAPRLPGDPVRRPPMSASTAAQSCLGFFQLFRHEPGRRFGSYQTAARYDLDFAYTFGRREALASMYVLHLGPQDRENWAGRVVPRWGAA